MIGDSLSLVIYRIYCEAESRSYVGATAHYTKRCAVHKWHLRSATHHNKSLQTDWHRYGETAFRFEIIEAICRMADLAIAERKWISAETNPYNIDRKPMYGHHKRRDRSGRWGRPLDDHEAAQRLMARRSDRRLKQNRKAR